MKFRTIAELLLEQLPSVSGGVKMMIRNDVENPFVFNIGYRFGKDFVSIKVCEETFRFAKDIHAVLQEMLDRLNAELSKAGKPTINANPP